jgi:aryl-alcohol dehydrogenase-like predicted oxidoreductase
MPDTPFALDHYRLLGASGLRVSPLCLGTMTFGTAWGWGADKAESQRQFQLYRERGGNFIDTACNYTNGESESFVGDFAEGVRDSLVIATKYTLSMNPDDPNAGGNHRKSMRLTVEGSLRRLRTDYIDLLYLHMWEYRTPIEEVLRSVDDLVRQGKVLYFGFSDTPAYKVSEACAIARLRGWTAPIAMQLQYSLVARTVEFELNEMARDQGLGLCPWGLLGGGVLTGKYRDNPDGDGAGSRAKGWGVDLNERDAQITEVVLEIARELGRTPSQVAVNWVLCQPGVASPLLGARTLKQLEDNLGAAEFALSAEQLARLDEASKVQHAFPYDFLRSPMVNNLCAGKAQIDKRMP